MEGQLSTKATIDIYKFNFDNINTIEDIKDILSLVEWDNESILNSLPDKYKKKSEQREVDLCLHFRHARIINEPPGGL